MLRAKILFKSTDNQTLISIITDTFGPPLLNMPEALFEYLRHAHHIQIK